jgi:serine/threonine protein kinase
LQEVDWWAVGVVGYEMLTGNVPFKYGDDGNEKKLLE